MSYGVHPLHDEADMPAALRVWNDNLPVECESSARYRWYYQDNPAGHGTLFVLCHRTPEGGSAVVGTAGVGPRAFRSGGANLPAMLLADFAVDKPHRTAGPAVQCQRALRDHSRGAAFIYGFPNTASLAIFRRVGYRELGQIRTYVRILRHAPVIGRRLRSPFAGRLMGWAVDALWGRYGSWPRAGRRSPGLRLELHSQIDPRVDELVGEASILPEVHGIRNARFLRWRFFEKPGLEVEFASLVDERTGRLRAYAVLVPAPPDGTLLPDFLAASENDLGLLLDRLATMLRGRGRATLRLAFLGRPSVVATIKAHGFLDRSGRSVVVVAGSDFATSEGLPSAESWYLTRADEDD